MAAKKKASGENIPENQRNTVQVKIRLPPELAERLDEIAEELGVTRSGAVGLLIDEHDEAMP
jgi:predicted DNA-binding protein